MNYWKIEIEVWPASTGAGADEDQKAAGERFFRRVVAAEYLRDALDKCSLIQEGIKANPRVWQTRITSISLTKDF